MSLAENLLNSLDETAYQNSRIAGIKPEEEHIVVDENRTIIVPNSLKTIAVKGDKDIETVTFDCVRYWDGHDLSTFAIYLNYVLPDMSVGTYIPEAIVTSDGEDVYHFDWKIKNNITKKSGKISFAITAIKTKLNDDGEIVVDKQWGSLPNGDCSIALGLDISNVPDEEENANIVSQMSAILEKIQTDIDGWLKNVVVQSKGISETSVMSQKAVTEEFDAVNKIISAVIDVKISENRLDKIKCVVGYYIHPTQGDLRANSAYVTTDFMEVDSGKTYTMQRFIGNATLIKPQNFVCGFDENKKFISAASASSVSEYVVPETVKFIRVSINDSDVFEEAQYQYVPYTEIVDFIPFFDDVTKIKESALPSKNDYLISRSNGSNIQFEVPDNKKNAVIAFHCNVDYFGESDSISIIQTNDANNLYNGIKITNTKIEIYYRGNKRTEEYEHGLTLKDYIDVIIDVSHTETGRANVIIGSGGARFKQMGIVFYGYGTYLVSNLTGAFTNCSLSYSPRDIKKDLWMFGDSYFDHWVQYALNNGFSNYLCDGHGGRKSEGALRSLNVLLTMGTPKKLFWCMGMNDGDDGTAVDTKWESCYNSIVNICKENKIELILCTIPNVPNIVHTYKNDIIRSSGYRYVDLAKAVGADTENPTWYSGLLSDDNVHPSTVGDKMIADFMVTQIPELK